MTKWVLGVLKSWPGAEFPDECGINSPLGIGGGETLLTAGVRHNSLFARNPEAYSGRDYERYNPNIQTWFSLRTSMMPRFDSTRDATPVPSNRRVKFNLLRFTPSRHETVTYGWEGRFCYFFSAVSTKNFATLNRQTMCGSKHICGGDNSQPLV